MRKIFKYLAGTFGSGIYNSGAGGINWIVSDNLPNYKAAAQLSNNAKVNFINSGSMITNPSVGPTSNEPIIKDGVTDYTPESGGSMGGSKLYASDGTLKKFNSLKFGLTLSIISDTASSFIPQRPLSALTSTLNTGYDAASDLMMNVNPLFGGIMKAGGLGSDILTTLGVGTDQVTTEDLILDSKFLKLTPLGLINSFGAKSADNVGDALNYNIVKADMGAGYGDVLDRFNTAEKYFGKKIGNVFGLRDRANRKIHSANYDLARLEDIWGLAGINRAIQGTLSDMAFNKENLRMKGGWQDGTVHFGRKGMIIEPARIRLIRTVQQKIKPKLVFTEAELEEDIQSFKLGGSFNVIPEGALHARLHHMEGAEDLTKKGIPVVVEKDGGELELQAEIELNEIIFRYEVTTEIEKLMKEGTDDAALECGKMLVKEIFENTQDRTGLIESLEEPKEEQEEVVKEHRVFLKGGEITND